MTRVAVLHARIRAGLRLAGLVLATVCAALPALVVRRLSLGSARPSLWVGSRCCRLWAVLVCRIIGLHREVEGSVGDGVRIVTANHVSYVDIFVLGSLYPSVFVAKQEIAGWPLFGWITRNTGTIFVDRERPRDVVRAGRAMRAALNVGISVTLFPEGRSTDGAAVLPFMPSLLDPAASSGTPCRAVTLGYETPGSELPPAQTVCWHSGEKFVPHLWRLLQLPRVEARVRFAPAPVSGDNRKELARRLREDVLDGFRPVRGALCDDLDSAPCGAAHSGLAP